MKNTIRLAVAISLLTAFASSTIDLSNLHNYANQPIPSYITRDNTPPSNPITDEGATLGRVLFYDKQLSADNTISCGTCHIQEHAFSDTANVSVGINGNLTPRHSMRLVNARFGDEEKFRWDESAATLEEQTTIPIKMEAEMGFSGQNGMPGFADLIAKMDTLPYYPHLFTLAFGDDSITEERIQKALAQFIRSIQSFDTKYDSGRAMVNSDTVPFPNFTTAENDGKQLFFENFQWVVDTHEVAPVPGETDSVYIVAKRISGGFDCATCHRPPEFSIDPNSLNNAFVRPASNFPGDPSWLDGTRSPTLRDLIKADGVTLNGGMFHSGQAHFLQDIFGHYEFRRLDTVDNTNLDPRMTRIHPTTGARIGNLLNSTPMERQRVNAFLRTLTGSDVYANEKWSDPFDSTGNLTLLNVPSVCDVPTAPHTDNITTTNATLNWTISNNSDGYQIRGKNTSSPNWLYLNIAGGASDFKNVAGLSNNVSYHWQIRSFCDGQADTSAWSELDTFLTGCYIIDTTWADPVISNGARLNWEHADGAVGYEIKGRRVGGPWATILVNGGNTTSKDVFGLLSATSYEWSVRSWCDANGNNRSDFTTLRTFTTTSASRVIEPARIELIVYPNPATEQLNIRFNSLEKEIDQEVVIVDVAGKVHYRGMLSSTNQSSVDVRNSNRGVYLIQVGNAVERFLLQ